MRVWIDLANSPHPLLFAPIARRLQERGHWVGVTARDNAQTAELTLQRWPDAEIIGGASPKSRALKAESVVARIPQLRRWAQSFGADVALSHNSYSQIVAARVLRLPVVTAMDYEGQPANHLAFRLADVILMPEALRDSAARRQGASERRTRFYPGFKEEVYLGDFEPDASVLDALELARDGRPLVVARTPPSRAAYHQFGNPLFMQAIQTLADVDGARTVVLARHPEQRRALRELAHESLLVPDGALDSRSLMYHADLVLGAGGTMTREAALMGVPTYSLFAGQQPAVDTALEREGRLRRLLSAQELLPLRLRPQEPEGLERLRERAERSVTAFVDAVVQSDPRG